MKERENPESKYNGPKYQTGQDCIEPGCHEPAGTFWSPYWCFRCNNIRMDRITEQFEALARGDIADRWFE